MPSPGRDHGDIRAVAAQEALDAVRGRRQLVVRTVTPIVLFILVLGATLVTRGADPDRRGAYRVAIEGDFQGSRATLEQLAPGRLVFEPSDDAALAAVRGAHLGLRLPKGLDERSRRSTPSDTNEPVVVFFRPSDPGSRAANALVRAGFAELNKRALLTAEDSPANGRTQITLEVTDVQLTETGSRRLSSGLVPALVILQASTLVAGTATRILGRRNRGLVTAQLLLPMSRWRMAIAKMLAELAVGMLAASPILAVVLVFVATISFGRDGVAEAMMAASATAVTAVALCLPMAAAGLFIGTAARTQEQVSLGTAVAVIVSATVAAIFALGELPPVGPLAAIPVAGSATALRDLLAGQGSVAWVLLATVSNTGAAALLTAAAARLFNSERLVLRSAT